MSAYRNAEGKLVVKVIAMEMGIYKDARRRPGTEFEMDEADIPRERANDGDNELYIFPKWVRPAGDVSRRIFDHQQKTAAQKAVDAAIYASGSKGARPKKDSFIEAMRVGPGRDEKAEAAALAASGTEGNKAKKEAIKEALGRGVGPSTPVK